jgi:hypothetical protein
VLDWHRRGYLWPGTQFAWSWRGDGKLTESIGVEVRSGYLLLRCSWQETLVPLAHTPCHYGGTRPWFLCPGCGRRVAVLYLLHSRFVCRRCGDVGYIVEHLSKEQRRQRREWRRWFRLCAMLPGGERKPKRMRWRTYRRIYKEIGSLDERIDNGLLPDFPRVSGLLDWQGLPGGAMGCLIVLTEEERRL